MKSVREGYKMTEVGEIPKEWKVEKLKEIANICYGKSQKEVETDDGKYKILGTGGVIGYTNDFLWDKPSVLIGRKGTIDKPKYIEEPFWTVDTLFYTKINENYIVKWFYYYLNNVDLKKYNEATGVPSLSLTNLNTINIATPKYEEQEKIASILSTVDEQIDNVDALIEKNKELKKGLMQTLLTKGIGHTKFKKTEIGEVPEAWEVKRLDDFNISNSYGPRFSSDLYDESGNCRVIRGTDVIQNGKVNYEGIPYANIDNQVLETHRLRKNDFVVVTTADCGVSFVFNNSGNYMPSAYMVRIRFNNGINPYFANKFFETKTIKKQVEQHIRRGTIANLPGSDLLKFKIAVPPIEEQEKIASILAEVDEKIEVYENKKQKLEELKKGLMQQLLTGKIRII